MDTHMDWLLSLATSLRSKFYDDSVESIIKKYLYQCIDNNQSIKLVTNNNILNQHAPIFIIADNPKQVYHTIINQLRKDLTIDESIKFRPITIITKLANREYILDVNGNQIIYGVTSKYANNELIKSIICRGMYSIKNYFNQTETTAINIKLLDPQLDLNADNSVNGGRSKQKKANKPTPRVSIKLKILTNLIQYVKSNSMFAGSLIYLNDLDSIDNRAIDIIYSDPRAKDAVIDYIKLTVQKLYHDYKFELNNHSGYFVPFDFRLRKLSCLIKHRKNDQTSYLVNLYNAATYDPIPSYRSIEDNECKLIAHPLVQMRFLYLDKFFLHSKGISIKHNNQFESYLQDMIQQAYNDLKKNTNKLPTWVGMYRDESFDRNQENLKSHIDTPYEVILI